MDMSRRNGHHRSQLFLVRLWVGDVGDDSKAEWSGRVQHVLSGQAHSFHDWLGLIDLLLAMLPPLEAGQQTGEGGEGTMRSDR
jgi:hypothetical protein